jgi:mono/diheme cytochrome c family protein
MVRSLKPIATILTALAVLGAVLAFAASAAPTKGNPADGKKIFTVKCVTCHKADGSGGMKLTPKGNPTPNWKDAKTWADPKRANDDYFRDCITNGKVQSGMVPWVKSGQVKPAEMENLIAYIHTFAPKAAAKK